MQDNHSYLVNPALKGLFFLIPLFFLLLWAADYYQLEMGAGTIILELITLPLLVVQLVCWGYGLYLFWTKSLRNLVFLAGLSCISLSVVLTTLGIF